MPNGGAFDMYRKRKVMKMGKRNDFMLFPGGKKKAMTFSYDDGVIQDRRLVELFNRYHVKGFPAGPMRTPPATLPEARCIFMI